MATINKVKPFFIRITDDMTPQIIQDALDKCVDSGAVALERFKHAFAKHDYEYSIVSSKWNCFGVNIDNETCFYDFKDGTDHGEFGGMQNEITLDQLDAHLGIESEVEWKNGDECQYKNQDDEWNEHSGRYVCFDGYANCHVIYACDANLYHASDDQIRKPETPQQRQERERLEAAYNLYDIANSGGAMNYEEFLDSSSLDCFLRVVDETNYRKS